MDTVDGIIETYGPALARVCASYEADPFLQEDLLQDVLMSIHRSLPSLRKPSSLGPFVFRIAHNRGVTHVIRQRAARSTAQTQVPATETADPEHQLIADERARRLRDAVRRLPLRYRQVMTLVLEDMSYAEIAETLGLSLSNVGVRVNRAKAQLREMLDAGR